MKQELKDLQAQVRSRRDYLNDQEDLIAQAIDEGNEALKSKRRELEEVKLEHEEALRQVVFQQQKKDEAVEQTVEIINKTNDLQGIYENKAISLRGSLDKLQANVNAATKNLRFVTMDTDIRLRDAEVKEKEIDAKQEMLNRAAEDLDKKLRKYQREAAVYKPN